MNALNTKAGDQHLASMLGGRGFGPGGTGGQKVPVPAAPPPPRELAEGEILLGHAKGGDKVGLHLGRLVAGRLLIQGNSGAGKSMLLRRLFEQSFGLIQQLLIDPDGEFSTLADAFDVAVMEAADVQRIGGRTFALHLREHRYSAVLDLSDATSEDRLSLVADIVSGLIEAPREHWQPLLVLVDEAQTLAPHYDTGDVDADTRKRSISSLADMMGRGRKRGIAGVIATQRIAETSKSVTAKVTNVIIGRTFLDVDLERAGKALGMTTGQSGPLRTLGDGEFMALGPALGGQRRLRFKAGLPQTQHKGNAPEIVEPPRLTAADTAALLQQLPDADGSDVSSSDKKRGRNSRHWTREEDEIIREGYEAGAKISLIVRNLVAAGHRSVSTSGVSMRAHTLGLASVRASVGWSDDEDQIIRDAYVREVKIMDIVIALAEAGFNRGRVAVQMRAIALGITRDRVNYWTEPEKAIATAGLTDGTSYREIVANLKAAGFDRGLTSIMKFAQKNNFSRAGESWTAEQIDRLRELYEAKTPAKEIAEELGKPISGIRSKASNLGLKQRVAWSDREFEILTEYQANGRSLTDAAQAIGRPYVNVARQANNLKLDFSPKRAGAVKK